MYSVLFSKIIVNEISLYGYWYVVPGSILYREVMYVVSLVCPLSDSSLHAHAVFAYSVLSLLCGRDLISALL